MAASVDRDVLSKLDALPQGSPERMRYALSLIRDERRFEVVLAALGALEDEQAEAVAADQELKPLLLARYAYLSENGPRRDPGCLLRARILGVLRRAFTVEDVPLLEAAACRYERVRESESAADLRARALVALDDVDGERASLHAVRLLGDTSASRPPDEASLTAVRVLAAREHVGPLYIYALLPGGHPALASECLRSLAALPVSLLPSLVESILATDDPAVVVGLMDLLISHDAWREFQETVLGFLGSTADLEAHYCVLTSIMAGRRQELVTEVVSMARFETDEMRLRNYVAALSLRDYDAEIADAVAALEARL